MNELDIKPYLETIEDELGVVLDDFTADAPLELAGAMKYAVLGGGKRVRPVLAMLTAEALGYAPEAGLWTGIATELLHSYSLIHDDLPCMDNDDVRRGKPTVHKQYGEATAVLAGDALVSLAHQYMLYKSRTLEARRASLRIADCASSRGMLAGQILDLAAANFSPNLEELTDIAMKKTCRLFSAAVEGTALALDADPNIVDALGTFSRNFGLAFQIADDIKDSAHPSEPNFARFLGADGAARKAKFHLDAAIEAINPLGPEAEKIKQFAISCIIL